MNLRIIKKALGLLIVDVVIIIGIFILQFRTDSNIIEKIGNLQLTFIKTEAESENILKNSFSAGYKGLSLHADSQHPAKILKKSANGFVPAILTGYEIDGQTATLSFEEDIKLSFIVSEEENNAPISISAELPSDVAEIQIPYNFGYNMKIQKSEGNHIIIGDKNNVWDFDAMQEDGFVHFTHSEAVAKYGIYDDTEKKFTFDSLTELAYAEEGAYSLTLSAFKENLINSFKPALAENKITELTVVAYVAAMSENGNFQQAVDEIPQSFKKSDSRTYLSAPYFNNLVNMNSILEDDIRDTNRLIDRAANSLSLDIFTAQNIAAYLEVYSSRATVVKLLENVGSTGIQSASVAQVTGIIKTYNELSSFGSEYAKLLEPVIPDCLEKLAGSCSFTNNILTISENGTFVSVVQGIEIGVAIMRYGIITNNQTYIRSGRVIVNSYMEESASFDLRTLSNLYPTLAYENWYYPHFEIVDTLNGEKVWAWTCAKAITITKDSEKDISIFVEFPETLSHYVILKNISPFETIWIYDTEYHSDPRFETYNAPGYVYRSNTNTLLLKSRHKVRKEKVRLLLK